MPNCSDCTNPVCSLPDTHTINHVDYMWRILLGLGCVPAVLALYFRLTIPETPRWTMDIERYVVQAQEDITAALHPLAAPERTPHAVMQRATAPRATRRDFRRYFGQWQNLKILLGTAYSWFAIDVSPPFLHLHRIADPAHRWRSIPSA